MYLDLNQNFVVIKCFFFFKLRKEWGFSKEVQVPHSSPAEVK